MDKLSEDKKAMQTEALPHDEKAERNKSDAVAKSIAKATAPSADMQTKLKMALAKTISDAPRRERSSPRLYTSQHDSPTDTLDDEPLEELDLLAVVSKRLNVEAAGIPTAPDISIPGAPAAPQAPVAPVAAVTTSARQVTPGAYSSAPGVSPQRSQVIDYSLLGRLSDRPGVSEEFTRYLQHNSDVEGGNTTGPIPDTSSLVRNTGLSQAVAVEDVATPETHAAPFDSSVLDRNKARERKVFCVFISALVVFVSGLVLGLLLGRGSQNGSDYKMASVPIISPSGAPSESPSASPTSSLDWMVSSLPESTRQNLIVFDSPQWKAFEWLSLHPHINDMEEWRKLQLFVLATFYHSMEGSHWRQEVREFWLLYDKHECDWFSSSFGRFIEGDYEYYNAGLKYPIAPCNEQHQYQAIFLGWLDLAEYKPKIPAEIALLNNLTGLILENSEITTSWADFIPPALYQMTNMVWLNFNTNKLSGSISSGLGKLTNLNRLYIFQNSLSGTLPSELTLLPKLRVLSAHTNDLSGTLPDQLSPALNRLELLRNQISGTIPTGTLGMSNLTYIDLKENSLTGSLPSELGMLTGMDHIFLHKNDLTGTLPTELGMMTNLYNLQLYGNAFSGQLASELGLLTGLDRLRLQSSNLSGSLPSEMATMQFLNWLQLEDNRLSGKFPEGLWRLPRLQCVNLQDNFFTGTLSTEIGTLPDLQFLDLESNSLTGLLPTQLGLLSKLEHLKLQGNSCGGPIPTEFGSMSVLSILTLGSNSISGQIPSELGLLSSLTELDLSDSLVSGTIPEELGELANSSNLSHSPSKMAQNLQNEPH